jgi:hypothetical protein
MSWILRWRCQCCAKRFTDYPPFALPYKRFVQEPVMANTGEYLGTDYTYCKTVEHEGMPIMYDDRSEAGLEKASGLAPSTVWRWLSWLGGMPDTLRTVLGLIREKEPNSTLHRQPWAVSPRKYRCQQRQRTLERAMQLLAADRVCESLFGDGIFPRYAMGRG